MGRKPNVETVQKFAEECGVEPQKIPQVVAIARNSDDWRGKVRSYALPGRDGDMGSEERETAELIVDPKLSEPPKVRWINIKVPVIEIPESGCYFSKSHLPQTIGSGSPISLSPRQSLAYAAVFRAIESLVRDGDAVEIDVSRTRKESATRVAKGPHDTVRFLLEKIAETA